MANRISEEQKIEINKLYRQIGTYSGVAKQLGVSPSTVKKYVTTGSINGTKLEADEPVNTNYDAIAPIDASNIKTIETPEEVYKATEINEEERRELLAFWKELAR